MASQNSVLGKRSLFRATALIRPGVVIVARTRESKHVSTSSLLFAGKQYSSLGKEAVERSMWLRVVRLITLARCCSRAARWWWTRATAHMEVTREAQVQENSSMGGKDSQQTEL